MISLLSVEDKLNGESQGVEGERRDLKEVVVETLKVPAPPLTAPSPALPRFAGEGAPALLDARLWDCTALAHASGSPATQAIKAGPTGRENGAQG